MKNKINKPIINSLLDTDLYKLTMMQIALHKFSTTNVEYKFKCRNDSHWNKDMLNDLNEEIKNFCNLRFTDEEIDYLRNIPFFKNDFIDFLTLYKPNIDHIKTYLNKGKLNIEAFGPWFLTLPFEVPVLAMVNEVYFRHNGMKHEGQHFSNGRQRLEEKIELANNSGINFADFGTRRRFSHDWQDEVIKTLCEEAGGFVGTSNLYFAKKYNIKPIGTMAHEYIMAGAGQEDVRLAKSQAFMLQKWVDEYRGDLGIALTDTYGFDAFLKDFDKYFAKLYDGLRHDSGNPFEWGEKALDHYKKLGVNPLTKTLVFSDGLDIEKAINIHKHFYGRVNVSFGIGTNLTNDFFDVTPLQIVMKIVKCNENPVAKVSDTIGKGMCEDSEYIDYVKKVFNIS